MQVILPDLGAQLLYHGLHLFSILLEHLLCPGQY